MKATRDEITGRWETDLPDVFDLICDKLERKEHFSFARYGDGEWNAIYGKQGANCDGHEYFHDMGQRLKDSVSIKEGLLMGMQPLTIASDRIKEIERDFPGIDWVNADSIHNASIDGKLDRLPLKDRFVVLVGPEHLLPLFDGHDNFRWVEVPIKNCWRSYREVYNSMSIACYYNYDPVFLLCASMMSEVLIEDFHASHRTIIDMGSVLDPYAGVNSRRYHHKLCLSVKKEN